MSIHYLCAVFALLALVHSQKPWECDMGDLQLLLQPNGSYSVAVDGSPWFPAGSVAVQSDGKQYSSLDGTLV